MGLSLKRNDGCDLELIFRLNSNSWVCLQRSGIKIKIFLFFFRKLSQLHFKLPQKDLRQAKERASTHVFLRDNNF